MDFENTLATATSAANFDTDCANMDFENTVAVATATSAANLTGFAGFPKQAKP